MDSPGTGSWTGVARRADPELGIEERCGFFCRDGLGLFTYLHAPQGGRPATTLVMCPSVLSDMTINYRREALLARRLAELGLAVWRFNYAGTGNSPGDPLELTLDALQADARTVATAALEGAASGRLAWLGTRLGALVAAGAAAGFAGSPLILWEPVLAADDYFNEGFRAQLVRTAAKRAGRRATREELEQELESQGWVDLVGHHAPRALQGSATGRTLLTEIGAGAHQVLLVRMANERLDGAYDAVAAALGSRGFAVDVALTGSREAWWFNPQPDLGVVDELAGRIAGWLEPRHGDRGR